MDFEIKKETNQKIFVYTYIHLSNSTVNKIEYSSHKIMKYEK